MPIGGVNRQSFMFNATKNERPAAGENIGCGCSQKKLSYHA